MTDRQKVLVSLVVPARVKWVSKPIESLLFTFGNVLFCADIV